MSDQLLQMETTCGSLLYELQVIWDEVGETDAERDKMLLELEQECLEVYRRKVDQANKSRAQLRRAIADHEAELAVICSAMGERPVHLRQSEQNFGSLKEELKAIVPQLEEMRKKKCERLAQFIEVVEQIRNIVEDISEPAASATQIDESDLSNRKLEELHKQLETLQKEKMDRLKLVLDHSNTLHSLCLVLGLDFVQTISEVHPSLNGCEGSKSISNNTLESLRTAILKLREIKFQRIQKLQDLATSLLELWNLMDTPLEEQQDFQKVTCKIATTEDEITEPGILSVEFLEYVEAEVSRLEELKSTKMKELVLKRRAELEEICRRTHLLVEEDTALDCAIEAIDSGAVDPSCILEQLELQVARVKEEAFSRKEILDKVEKWLVACEEESWLEEYNRDENRYNAGRGAHLTLKRAEKARALVNKLPAMVENLSSKIIAWEREKGIEFIYDGIRLLTMLDEYILLRQEKEEERIRKREEKRLQGQLIAEQEARYGSKPSPMKTPNIKKNPRPSTGNANRRLSLGVGLSQTPKVDIHSTKGNQTARKKGFAQQDVAPSTLSATRRGLDVDGLSVKKHSFNPSNIFEVETRKPFSPVSMKTNMSNGCDDMNTSGRESSLLKVTAPVVPSTPNKPFTVADEENVTPKVMGVPPKTPSTISIPMQTAMTPATAPPVAVLQFGGKESEQVQEQIEYSFEERRLGFIVSKENLRAVYA